MDEAGRSTEPPPTMAPPRREGAPEADNGAVRSGIMAPPPKVDSEPVVDSGLTVDSKPERDAATSSVREEVPFPADNIGHSLDAAVTGKDEQAKDERAEDDKRVNGTGSAPDAAKDADDGAGSSRGANGVLEGGLQTVKQAVAATNNWFTSRVAKAEPTPRTDEAVTAAREDAARRGDTPRHEDTSWREDAARRPDLEAGASVGQSFGSAGQASGAAGRPGAVGRPDVSSGSPSSFGSGTQPRTSEGAGGSPPKWNDPYPTYSAPVPPSSRTAPLGAAPLAPDTVGSGPASPPASRGWAAKPPRSAVSTRRHKASAKRNRRQAHLSVARVEPWSVMKFSFVVSVVAFIILFVAVAILYAVLSSIGVFDSLQRVVTSVTSSQTSSGSNIRQWFSASKVLGYTGLLGSLNIVLITAMSTIGAVIYNLISRVFGGIEITLRETD